MTQKPVSVVVVSRGQPERLCLCLTAISQLQHTNFEVVVVADSMGIEAVARLPFSNHLKLVDFDLPNASAARNLGVCYAAGDFVAFIEGDAVPAPSWLSFLVAPAEYSLSVMAGFVCGPKGINWRRSAQMLDELGHKHPLQLDPVSTTVLTPAKGRAIKTDGTNMAVRRDVLVDLGGFDAGFHNPLDEVDMNMRLAQAGHKTAIIPTAEVHHTVKADLRTRSELAEDFFELGANWAMFQRKHIAEEKRAAHWAKIVQSQKAQALRYLVNGTLEPRDVGPLQVQFEAGYEAGQIWPIDVLGVAVQPAAPFARFPSSKSLS